MAGDSIGLHESATDGGVKEPPNSEIPETSDQPASFGAEPSLETNVVSRNPPGFRLPARFTLCWV